MKPMLPGQKVRPNLAVVRTVKIMKPTLLLVAFAAFTYSSQPASSQPASSQPASSQPVSSQPASSQPVSSQPVLSQPARSDDAADIAALRKQTAKSKRKKAKNGVVLFTTKSGARVTVSGLLQMHYRDLDGVDVTKAGSTAISDGFRLRRARLVFHARMTRRLHAKLGVDFASRLRASRAPVGGKSGINQRSSILKTAEISFLLHRQNRHNRDYLDVGQFTLPVGYEGDLVSSNNLQMVDRALMFTQRDEYGRGGYGSMRDKGVELRGVHGQFDYRLGVFKGLGERQNVLNLNGTNAYVGRLIYRPSMVKGLRIGISAARGNSQDTSALVGPPPSQPGNFIHANRSVLNLFAAYKRRHVTAQTEFMRASSRFFGEDGLESHEIESHYVSFGYRLNKHLEGVARYDFFNFDRQLPNAAASDTTLGINYYLKGNNAKIQANFVQRNGGSGIGGDFPSGTSRDFRRDRTELRLNFQTAF